MPQRIALPRDRPSLYGQADEFAGRSLLALARQRLAPDEVSLLPLHGPAQRRLERRRGLIDVVAVEHEPRLETERIPCSQPHRHKPVRCACLQQCAPDCRRIVPRWTNLKAVLSRVPAAGQKHPPPRNVDFRDRVEGAHLVEGRGRKYTQDARRGGTLQRDQRHFPRNVADRRAVAVVFDPGQILRRRRRVNHEQITRRRHTKDGEVVDDPAVRITHRCVEPATDLELRDVVGDEPPQQRQRARPLDHNLSHVRDVEEPGARADRLVLFDDPRVLDGHLPSREGHDARAVVEVRRVQRSPPENLSLAGHGYLSATTCAAALPGDSPLVERGAGSWVRPLRWRLRGRAAPPLRGLPE